MCRLYCIKHEITNAIGPGNNNVAERAHGLIHNAALVAWIQPLIAYPHTELTPSETLGAEAVLWASKTINDTATKLATSRRTRCGTA